MVIKSKIYRITQNRLKVRLHRYSKNIYFLDSSRDITPMIESL